MRLFKGYVRFICAVLAVADLLLGASCMQQEKAARLNQIPSLTRLQSLASSGRMRIENPGNGFTSLVVAGNRNALSADNDPVFDVVVKGELSNAGQTLIKSNYIDAFTLLLLKGNRFRVKRASGASAPQVFITMSGQGRTSGVRAELIPIAKPPYTIARLHFSTGALPDFNLTTGGRGLYAQADFRADLGGGANTNAADYHIPLQRLLKFLFEIEYPRGTSGSISGNVFLLRYEVKQVQAQSILFNCLFYVEIE